MSSFDTPSHIPASFLTLSTTPIIPGATVTDDPRPTRGRGGNTARPGPPPPHLLVYLHVVDTSVYSRAPSRGAPTRLPVTHRSNGQWDRVFCKVMQPLSLSARGKVTFNNNNDNNNNNGNNNDNKYNDDEQKFDSKNSPQV